jgi:excinuclease UvrABC nuclease subunit
VPRFRPNKEGEGLPETSGVYFLWSNSTVEYVGKSVRLKPRSPRQRKESPTPPRISIC